MNKPVELEILALSYPIEPAQAYPVITADSRYSYWLDSALASSSMSHYSYIGVVPEDSQILHYVHAGTPTPQVHLYDGNGTPNGTIDGDIWEVLHQKLETAPTPASGTMSSPEETLLLGGYVGYFGYETHLDLDIGANTPHAKNAPRTTPDALWFPATNYLIYEHRTAKSWLVGDSTWIHHMERQLRNLTIYQPIPAPQLNFPTPSKQDYCQHVETCLEQIHDGNSYEVCLTTATHIHTEKPLSAEEALGIYLAQREKNPAPYAAFFNCAGWYVLSSSPERYLQVKNTGIVETKPIKGTIPRSHDPVEDQQRAQWLRDDPKTRAENLMIVDLLRNDLSTVSQPGTVNVPVLMGVESYSTVHQLVSTIRSQLREGITAVDAAAACFPGGSMTGAPKASTMSIIDSLEKRARGVYSGALGFFSADGSAELSIVIRTLIIDADGTISVSAGGAIVYDSHPEAEYQEMLTKLNAAVPHRGQP
ncbi:aminodeoxychorismate synthase component I [Rothia sp. P13129]|uniref:aminodeoxychorismate synthase component I n=1 Tax=Rothia sp. P13129 TaxID=3402664 RepID=UPI003ABF8D63